MKLLIIMGLFVLGMMVLGYLLPFLFPSLKRTLVPPERNFQKVEQRAKAAFLEEGVMNTEERVGILIFVSYIEHLVIIMGDQGINQKVTREDWEDIVKIITNAIRSGKVAQGMVEAIEESKQLLLRHGFTRKSTDTNELSNELRTDE
jgi:putative membrane protein